MAIRFQKLFRSEFYKDIRFWIVLFFIIRLYGITNPPLEVSHSWRQTTVTMVARNFYEVDANIFYPRIDFAGEKTGITGMEFPVLNYLIYLVSLLFGYTHWYGRLINLFISSVGIFYFYKIITKYFDEKLALQSSVILLSSLWFAYSRKIMPDIFSMSLTIIGLYFGTQFLDRQQKRLFHLLLFFLFTLIGILSKLPSGYILILFVLFLVNNELRMSIRLLFSATMALILLLVGIWYYYWVPELVAKFGFWHFFMGKDLTVGVAEIYQHLNDTLSHFYDAALK
ncbi:MAG: hypothetical protein HOO86_13265, partial [Bacteroidales bacterium]|nr:hypothetical protein [Bacteroidales bacterium]